MTAKCLLGESMKVMAKALGDRNLGENTRARAKVAALLLIVVVTGTTRDNTVTTEDGEDNTLDLCIGLAGWRKHAIIAHDLSLR